MKLQKQKIIDRRNTGMKLKPTLHIKSKSKARELEVYLKPSPLHNAQNRCTSKL